MKAVIKKRAQNLLDARQHLIDLKCFGNVFCTLGIDLVVAQTASEGANGVSAALSAAADTLGVSYMRSAPQRSER